MSEWTIELVWEDFYAYICSTELSFDDESVTLTTHNLFVCNRCSNTHLLSHSHAQLLRESIIEVVGEAAVGGHMGAMKRIKLVTYFREHPELLPGPESFTSQEQTMEMKLRDFKERLCSSNLIPTRAQSSLLRFDCVRHGRGAHYITQQDWKDFKNDLDDSTSFLNELSELPAILKEFIRIEMKKKSVKMWEQFVHERIIATFSKEDSTSSKNKQRSKKRKQLQKTSVVTSDVTLPESTAMKYIVPPDFVPRDLLIEYHVCGRKIQYSTEAEAAAKMVANGCPPVYSTYKCSYCPGFHYGAGEGKNSAGSSARSGLRWYTKNAEKANKFMYKIMTE